MKTTVTLILFLSIINITMAQYVQPNNNKGIYTIESEVGDKMTIIQNKESNNLTIEYSLLDSFTNAVLIVLDNSGRVIVQHEILYIKDQLIITLENWPSGQYTVSLYADKKSILSRQIML